MGDMSEETITLYEAIGGDATIRKLVRRFYELMDTLPEARHVRATHPPSLANAEEKLYEYLTGYLGGATATQVRLEDPWYLFPVAFGVLVWLGLYLRDRTLRSLLPLRS